MQRRKAQLPKENRRRIGISEASFSEVLAGQAVFAPPAWRLPLRFRPGGRLGVRPRDWPPGLVTRLQRGAPDSELGAAVVLYFFHEVRGRARGRREPPAPGSRLARRIPAAAGRHCLEAAYMVGPPPPRRGDGSRMARIRPSGCGQRPPCGQYARAITAAQEGLESCLSSISSGGGRAERSWLRGIIEAIRQALAGPPGG